MAHERERAGRLLIVEDDPQLSTGLLLYLAIRSVTTGGSVAAKETTP